MPTPRLLFVCTGNATRSVIAAALVRLSRPEWVVESRGTLVVEGAVPSHRTRAAMEVVGISDHRHASRQLRDEDLDEASLVVCFERDHVTYVRRRHPHAAARTATIRRLVRDLPAAPADSLDARVAALRLDDLELEPWEDVDDPGGGDVETFRRSAVEVEALVADLLARIDG